MVGAGRMANEVHYPSLASFDDVQFAGICDLDISAMDRTGDQYGIEPRYQDYRQLIEETNPDGVCIVGQPHLMYDLWVWCLQQGLNLFIEKPMGINLHQAEMLAYLADKHDCITQVCFQRRSCPLMVKMRRACLERGPITHAVCEFYKHDTEPYLVAPGYMPDDCSHSIDTLRWMCGGEVEQIESRCKRVGVPNINWIGATVHFDNGTIGYMITSRCSGRRVFRVEMHAPGIYADVEPEALARVYRDDDYQGAPFDTHQVAGSEEFYVFAGFRAKHREFIDSLKQGEQLTSSPFSDAVKTMRVAEQILAQDALRGA